MRGNQGIDSVKYFQSDLNSIEKYRTMNDSNNNSKQKEYNDLMDLIRKSYTEEEIEKFNSYSSYGKQTEASVQITTSNHTYGN